MSRFARLVAREWRRGLPGLILPVAFFLLVATLFPFAVGPDATLLARTGGGALWIAALLAALLPVERLVAPDLADGVLDALTLAGIGEELAALAKATGHWLGFGPALMLAAVPAAALLRLDAATLARLELGLLIGTPGLAALGVATAALTAGLRAGALAGLILLPLAAPLLIFGAGSLATADTGAVKLLAASSLLLVAGAPFVSAAAIRAARG